MRPGIVPRQQGDDLRELRRVERSAGFEGPGDGIEAPRAQRREARHRLVDLDAGRRLHVGRGRCGRRGQGERRGLRAPAGRVQVVDDGLGVVDEPPLDLSGVEPVEAAANHRAQHRHHEHDAEQL